MLAEAPGQRTPPERTSTPPRALAPYSAPHTLAPPPASSRPPAHGTAITRGETHHLPLARTSLDIADELLLLLLELGALAVEFALRLLQRALVLPQPLGGRLGAPEEGLDNVLLVAW